MSSFAKCFVAIIMFATVLGCSKENPNPELMDPIYKDLHGRSEDLKKSLGEAEKEIEDLKKALLKAEPHTLEKKNIERDLASAQKLLVADRQRQRYFEIRAERRKLQGRVEYKKAFARGEEWPKPSEYSDYQVNNRLREATLNWNARVPKLQDRLLSPEHTEKKEHQKPAKH